MNGSGAVGAVSARWYRGGTPCRRGFTNATQESAVAEQWSRWLPEGVHPERDAATPTGWAVSGWSAANVAPLLAPAVG